MVEGDSRIALAIDGGKNISPHIERLLRRAGIPVELKKNGKLYAELEDNPFVKSVAVNHSKDLSPLAVAGFYQAVIYGRDWLREAQLGGMEIEEVLATGLSVCGVVIEVPEVSSYKRPEDLEGLRVAARYVNLTRHYFWELHHTNVEIVELNGGEEGAVAAGVADAAVAAFDTGGTAGRAKLRILEQDGVIVEKSEAVIAVPTNFLNEQGSNSIYSRFIYRMQQAIENPKRRTFSPFPQDSGLIAVLSSREERPPVPIIG